MTMTTEKKIGVYEVASELGVSHTTVYSWVNDKDLPYTTERQGLKLIKRFLLSEVKEWLSKQ